MTFPLLTALALVPLVGGLLLFFVKGGAGRLLGLGISLATLALGLVAFFASGDLAEQHTWISSIGAHYALGLDGMAKAMVLLTVILVPIVLLAEWKVGEQEGTWSTSTFFALALILEGLALYVFMATDALLFYLFFEATLIPMYFLVGGWGGPKRGQAALKFLLYSLAGGLVLLFGIIGLGAHSAGSGKPSFLISDLAALHIDGSIGRWLWAAFFIAFAIKAPMVPVHTWLPDTAEQATPGASTLLVGILDKIGTFGMIRFCLTLFPEASKWATPVVLGLAVLSILYGALMAIGSKDLLRLVSYTSVSHFGFMVLGIFAFTSQSMNGTIFYMLNHGFSTAALFLVVGFLIRRRGSASIDAFGGVQKLAPVAAGLFLVSGLSAMALPGMSSFISEFMVMAGAWQRHPVVTAISTLGTVLAALYILLAYQRTMTGPVTEQADRHFTNNDLDVREKAVMAPLVALLLVLGFLPMPMLHVTENTAKDTMSQIGMTDPEPAAKGVK
ncbi:NADH dehydrogenase subunit M [Luteococcus japonicus]|uniref:NADH-ubiquinone oxidoreductase chain M n=2 Tax=Luteococcus japonicus TaxID=33984 RepID=A0A1R4J2W3_9ACTN|nr:NADH-quinone oxidoreductase subunit M [Luteococcus japonicus]ROR53987.1 NADH dehydrogenase subunit M [Luteococcus japonicus]SJN26416.1 NADH-ubiquinone oxidoreductase chain M [Luteococcus japonicus LSP_Lj1]